MAKFTKAILGLGLALTVLFTAHSTVDHKEFAEETISTTSYEDPPTGGK